MESPLVALLASSGADSRVHSRGFASWAHLLAPFSTHHINIRDPSNAQYVSSKISLDIRDIRRQGHLLSLSVLPFVLQESLVSGGRSVDSSLGCFSDSLHRWSEPSEQECLRTYVACLFIIAGCEENPLGQLSQLIQLQHTQQHATTETRPIGPSHCAPPKWTTPNTLKHYILVHDAARDDETRTTEVFNQMCITYGVDSCQLLRIGVGPSDGLPDAWKSTEESDRLLERGLARARQHATAAAAAAANNSKQTLEKRDSLPPSVSTISPSYGIMQSSPATSSPSSSINGNGTNNSSGSSSPISSALSQRLASSTDREACGKALEKFLKDGLVPHAERLLRTLNDQLADKRGIGKSLTSGMKKWFGSTASTQNSISGPASYAAESVEMKSRRLADLAFQFGLYSFAHSQYRSVKKEFEGEQAWLYHAAALEMSAVALQLSGAGLTVKQFPVHYLEQALTNQLNNSGSYTAVMRCALNGARVLAELGQHKDAALMLSRVANLDSDQCVGVAQAQAAVRFAAAGQSRKAAFYRVLAGNRFIKASLKPIAIECYRLALPEYYEKHWDSVEDHLCSLLSCELPDPRMAMDCAARLLRASQWQSASKQSEYVDNFVRTLSRFQAGKQAAPSVFPLPLLDSQSTRVICGERPLSDDVTAEEDSTGWPEIERAAFHCLAGSSTGFRATQLVSDSSTDNSRLRETPPDERFRVRFRLTNPLVAPLQLYNVRLGVAADSLRVREDMSASGDSPFSSQHVIHTLTLEPEESREVELWLVPRSGHLAELRVDSVLLDLADSQGKMVCGRIPFQVRGKRLNKSPQQMQSVVHAADERLHTLVAGRRWPLLDFRCQRNLQQQQPDVYCSQAVKLVMEVENIGHEPVNRLCLASDGVDCIDFAAEDEDGQSIACTSSIGVNSCHVRVFNLSCLIPVGATIRIAINVRAPSIAHSSSSSAAPFLGADAQSGGGLSLLFFYRGVSGAFREWRTALKLPTTTLVQATATVLDSTHGLVLVNVANRMPASSAALARVEVLRIRAVKQRLTSEGDWQMLPSPGVTLQPVRSRLVQLDSDQSDNICVTMTGCPSSSSSSSSSFPSEVWLSEAATLSPPCWPAPRPPSLSQDEMDGETERNMTRITHRQLAVLWKASVVNNDGHVTMLLGEEFVDCPFSSAGLSIPGLEDGPSSSMTSSSPSRTPSDDKENASPAITVNCSQVQPITHDFTTSRLCEVPMTMTVCNRDPRSRLAEVTVRFVGRVREPVVSLQQVPPDSRQLWWPDRPIARAMVEPGEQHQFSFRVRVGQPSVYELGGSQMSVEAQFANDANAMSGANEDLPIIAKVPCTLVVVNAK